MRGMEDNQKRCFKCLEIKPLSAYYKHKQMGDGHLNKCKECTKKDVSERYSKDFDKVRAYEVKRSKSPERRKNSIIYQRTRRLKDPQKDKARNAVNNAIRDKRLMRQPCVKCGEPKSQAHHHDYSKPLDVIWLCFKCHRLEHGHINVIR